MPDGHGLGGFRTLKGLLPHSLSSAVNLLSQDFFVSVFEALMGRRGSSYRVMAEGARTTSSIEMDRSCFFWRICIRTITFPTPKENAFKRQEVIKVMR